MPEHLYDPDEFPGRASLEDLSECLANEATSTIARRVVGFIHAFSDGYAIDVWCGTKDSEKEGVASQSDSLHVTYLRHSGPGVTMDELITDGPASLFAMQPPDEYKFAYGEITDTGLGEQGLAEVSQRMAAKFSPELVAWIERAKAVASEPYSEDTSYRQTSALLDEAALLPEPVVQKWEHRFLANKRFINGWQLDGSWLDANEAALQGQLRTDWPEMARRIRLYNQFTREDFWYIKGTDGNEAAVFEADNPEARFALAAIGYETASYGDWEMWHKDIGMLGFQQPPDTALGDFANRVTNQLTVEQLGPHDIYMFSGDGTVKIHRPDGTIDSY
ncbi:MAG TPA: hypothetical protein VLG16_00465 [Candidatus Saccharimonadales bacterium]|nr:hypothetical protein [Candidatus Saccharimonadales bacterium]